MLAAALLGGCAAPANEAPARSPSNDYQPAPPTAADGEVIGADRVPPAQKLDEGPRVETDVGAPAKPQRDE